MHSLAEDLIAPGPGFVPADRVARLGTETVFAVSAEAAALTAQGRTIYPFHLGDLNIPTAEPVVEAMLRAVRDGKTTYCANAGVAPLREALAADVGAARGVTYTADDVSVQPGGKPVIGKWLMAAMNMGDEVLYPNPGFPIYASFIEFVGGVAVPYGYVDDGDRYTIDIDAMERRITPRTRLLILNDLHNPTAAECTAEELDRIAEIALKHDLLVLSDEAYFDVRFAGASESIVSRPGMQERTVILYTFSKKYAMTGWRLGAAVGPKPVIDIITRMNVNMESCPNHFAQYGALAALTGDQAGPREMMARLQGRRDAALRILNETPGRALSHAGIDVLPVSGRHRRRPPDRLRRSRGLPAPAAGQDRRLVLHPPALREGSAGRDRVPSPSGVFRRDHRTDRGGPRRVQGLHRIHRARRVLDPPRRHQDERPARRRYREPPPGALRREVPEDLRRRPDDHRRDRA